MDWMKVLEDLIRIDTSVPPGNNYEKVVDYLEPLFQQAGCQTQKIYIPKEHAEGLEGRVNLLAHRRNPGKPRLIFYSHIDVVPAEGWDAFNPRTENGKLYGRGAADMKGSVAGLLLALNIIKDKMAQYDLSAMVTTDEETTQTTQIEYLDKLLEPLKDAYFFDLDAEFGHVNIAGLGAIHLEIKVKGKSVHSGLAHLGINAVEDAILLENALMRLKKKVTARKSKIKANPETKLKFLESRLNINMIKGGLKVNILPDECLISVDRRLIPEENLEAAETEIMNTLNSIRGVTWEVVSIQKMPTTVCDDPIVDKLAAIIKKVTGRTGKYGIMGSGDFAINCKKWGAKNFGIGVIRPDCNIHGKDEFVYLKDVEDLGEIIAQFITKD